jgi:hypothetical protein
VPDYEIPVEKVFLQAATYIIRERQDLYLWGFNTIGRRKRLRSLPSWVPDWSAKYDEETRLHWSENFASCIEGHFQVVNNHLLVDGHILDTIHFVISMDQEAAEFDLIFEIHRFLDIVGSGLFDAYRTELSNETAQNVVSSQSMDHDIWLNILGHTFAVLTRLTDIPEAALHVLSGLGHIARHPLDHKRLNIDALWAALTPQGLVGQERSPLPGTQMFLAGWYWMSVFRRSKTGNMNVAGLPRAYGPWLMAAGILCETGNTSWQQFVVEHFCRMNLDDDFFVTRSGYFGRSPRGQAKGGHKVLILGGAWRPYILEEMQDHYQFVCHAYVQGIMNLSKLPADSTTTRIEIH